MATWILGGFLMVFFVGLVGVYAFVGLHDNKIKPI